MTARAFDRCTWAIALATLAALLLLGVARAQDDPCDACIAEHGWAQCPCLPVVPEPVGGTIPPVTGVSPARRTQTALAGAWIRFGCRWS